jgi:hypothetical protein
MPLSSKKNIEIFARQADVKTQESQLRKAQDTQFGEVKSIRIPCTEHFNTIGLGCRDVRDANGRQTLNQAICLPKEVWCEKADYKISGNWFQVNVWPWLKWWLIFALIGLLVMFGPAFVLSADNPLLTPLIMIGLLIILGSLPLAIFFGLKIEKKNQCKNKLLPQEAADKVQVKDLVIGSKWMMKVTPTGQMCTLETLKQPKPQMPTKQITNTQIQ